MDYICYISRTKVDQLYGQIDPVQVSEIKEQLSSEVSRSGGVGIAAPALLGLKGDLTYGRKNVIQYERKVKVAYVEKLRQVLLAIYADHGEIPDLEPAVKGGKIDGIYYYYYEGLFRCQELKDAANSQTIVTISATIDSVRLNLDCSLRHFSESSDSDLIHSGNHAFFHGYVQLKMATVCVILGRRGQELYSTPLYLKLSAPDGAIVRDAL